MLEFQTFSKKREIRSLIYGESLSRVKGPPAYRGSYPGRANFSHIFFKNVEKRENENQKGGWKSGQNGDLPSWINLL